MVIVSWVNENTKKDVKALLHSMDTQVGLGIKALYSGHRSTVMVPYARATIAVHSKNLWQWETDNAD